MNSANVMARLVAPSPPVSPPWPSSSPASRLLRSASLGWPRPSRPSRPSSRARIQATGSHDPSPLPSPSRQDEWQLRQAEEWMKAQQNGMEEEDIVAATFGKESDQLTELEKKYADKLVALMQTKIAQVKKRDAKAKQQILIGKRAYAKGNYSDSIPYFEKACEYTTSDTLVGGEALMWKALALDGSGKLEQAKAIYLDLKEGHPLPSIRNQAGDLLYILEAPKLKIREEERLKIPDLQEVDEFRNRRKTTRTTRPRKTPKPLKKSAPTWEDKFYAKSPVVRAFKNRYVQVAFLVVSTGLSIYGAVYIK